MDISKKDVEVLRALASEYMSYASLPVQKEKIDLWKSINRGKMKRPMFLFDQLPWHELNADGEMELHVEHPFWRRVEEDLRQKIYKWMHFPADMVLDPFVTFAMAVSSTGLGLVRLEETQPLDEANSVVSHKYFNQIQNEEDIEKIKDISLTHDVAETALRQQQADFIFDGICPARPAGTNFDLGIWDYLTQVMGVDTIFYELIDRPEFMHKLAERVTSAIQSGIDAANKLNVFNDVTNYCHCSHIYTDELLPDSGMSKGGNSKNCWTFGLAQLFTSVSPAITEEFEIPYVSKLAENYGMIYYGCCDRLDDRLDLVKRIKNVKKVSCSPWSNNKNFAENIGESLIMSYKPNPAYLAVSVFDEDLIRNDLQETYDLAKQNNVNLEFILKDISTVGYKTERLEIWNRIAREIVEK